MSWEVAKSQQTLFNFPFIPNPPCQYILGKESCEITLESGGLIVHPVNANIGMPSSAWASKILLLDPLAMGVKWTPPAVATGWYANLQITKLQENSEQCKFWEYTNELYYLPGHLWWGVQTLFKMGWYWYFAMHLPHLHTITPRIRLSAVGPLYKHNVTEPEIHTNVCLHGMPYTLGFVTIVCCRSWTYCL